jgi:uncharacterized membrane protein
MATAGGRSARPAWSPKRFTKARWRLLVSGLFGLALIALLPSDFLHVTRLLIGWDAGIALYLVLIFFMAFDSDSAAVCRHAAMQDEGRYAVPILTVTAGMASLAAIIVWLHLTPDTESQPTHLALLFLTTLLSWAFIHTIFALHYAHEYYAEHRGKGSGLRFPGGGKPNYWDFTYFAFTIGTSNAVSDVEITSRTIRKTVTVHSLVAFIFNVTMIALTVSIAGDAISGQ